jgi:hypothetical protein
MNRDGCTCDQSDPEWITCDHCKAELEARYYADCFGPLPAEPSDCPTPADDAWYARNVAPLVDAWEPAPRGDNPITDEDLAAVGAVG